MSDRFQDLPAYAFPRLRALLDAHVPGGPVVPMSIGEPTHAQPPFVGEVLAASLEGFGTYPVNEGTPELLDAIGAWTGRRYGVPLPPDRILALNGTREGLFSASLALCPQSKAGQRPVVLLPNPFYGAYLAGALAAGAEPVLLPATESTGHLPDLLSVPPAILDRTALAFVASPSNPQGAVATRAWWTDALALAERHGFRLVADECYGEIYRDTPPDGVLAAAHAAGADPETALAFHSLSKRSNLPGLRSGFVAGGPRTIAALRALRAYGGAPLPGPLQRVAARAWADEAHVDASRALYREKYAMADRILGDLPGYRPPDAGFFLWLPVPERIGDGEAAALRLWREAGVRVLPGAYLGRDAGTGNPGDGYIRVALVAPPHDVETGLAAIARSLRT